MLVVYISYSISEPYNLGLAVWTRHQQSVELLAAQIARLGLVPVIPTALPGISHRAALRLDHELIRRADAMFVHQSEWTARSRGMEREIRWARELGLPIFHELAELRQWKRSHR